jgi:hypothetical protein
MIAPRARVWCAYARDKPAGKQRLLPQIEVAACAREVLLVNVAFRSSAAFVPTDYQSKQDHWYLHRNADRLD